MLPDPVFLKSVEGTLGDSHVRVEHIESITPLIMVDDDKLAELVQQGLRTVDLLGVPTNARLLAAMSYVQRAARLNAAGESPWEFMAEALLNYAKTLEVLFGDSREEQRAGLRSVGTDEALIEARFIPVTLLRDFLDVGHPKLAQLDSERLRGIHRFLLGLDRDFQKLLIEVRVAVANGTFSFRPNGRETLGTPELRTIDTILTAHAARQKPPGTRDA